MRLCAFIFSPYHKNCFGSLELFFVDSVDSVDSVAKGLCPNSAMQNIAAKAATTVKKY